MSEATIVAELRTSFGKGAARKTFEKLHPTSKLLSVMLDAIAIAKGTEQWRKDGGQYIPHPNTWLRQERWEDEMQQQASDEYECHRWAVTQSGFDPSGAATGQAGSTVSTSTLLLAWVAATP